MDIMNAPQSRKPRLEQSPQNRSLERGIDILCSFRPGVDLLGNGELAERTGLSRATVSRLTQTLVGAGMLEHDRHQRAYRLAAPVLSLAHAMRSGSPVLRVAAPLMRKCAERLKVNVGLAVADGQEMIYLESVRYNRKVSLRNIVAGQRVPIVLTSLGRAWLAAAPAAKRKTFLAQVKSQKTAGWQPLEQDIAEAVGHVQRNGFCSASWQPEVLALATPIVLEDRPVYVLNISVSTEHGASRTAVVRNLSAPLMNLAAEIREAMLYLR